MSKPNIRVKRTRADAVIPTKANPTDSGYDLTLLEGKKLSDRITRYDTGIAIEVPEGYYVEVFPRSSFSKSGYMMANSVGIIDNHYRGSILVTVIKVDENAPELQLPSKSFQFILKQYSLSTIEEVDELSDTDRGDKGFGSSG
jgi:dUTP pyrophosphatase